MVTRILVQHRRTLISFIQDSADKHIPSKTSRSVSSIPWITPEIRRKIRRKNKTHAKAKNTGSSKLRSKFETLRREIKADVRKQHDLYVNNLVGDVKANPRDFYRYINSQKKDTQGIPPLKRKNGKGVAQLDLEKAEGFNCQFTDVFSKNEHTQVPLLDRSAPFMNEIAVSKDGVIKLLKYTSIFHNNLRVMLSPLKSPVLRKYSNPFKRPGMYPSISKCNAKRCNCCMYLCTNSTVTSSVNGRKFSVVNNSDLD